MFLLASVGILSGPGVSVERRMENSMGSRRAAFHAPAHCNGKVSVLPYFWVEINVFDFSGLLKCIGITTEQQKNPVRWRSLSWKVVWVISKGRMQWSRVNRRNAMGISPCPGALDSAHFLQMPPWGRQGAVECIPSTSQLPVGPEAAQEHVGRSGRLIR